MRLSRILREMLTEESLEETNLELKKHLEQAIDVARKSYELANQFPDQANPTFGQEVAGMLKGIYNALSTGKSDDDSYADEIFK